MKAASQNTLRYRGKAWLAFRRKIIERDGGVCLACGRREGEAVLQVHHKAYLPGKEPWDYPEEMCETLCKGCHVREHGLVMPDKGWVCHGSEDLEDLIGECEVCGTDLRHVFFISHEKWSMSLNVGTDCCDRLTETTEASDERRRDSRRRSFIESPRWKAWGWDGKGVQRIHEGLLVIIALADDGFQITAASKGGKLRFPTMDAAKSALFDLIDSGEMRAFMEKQSRRR